MLRKWIIPITDVDPATIKLDWIHAALSRLVDADHKSQTKPWALSPLRCIDGVTVAEVSTLTDDAAHLLVNNAVAGTDVRFGPYRARLRQDAILLQESPWPARTDSPHRQWELNFLTPATFRRDNRMSPWPEPLSIIRSLRERWNCLRLHDPISHIDPRDITRNVWISDLDGRSETLRIASLQASGFVGTLHIRCDSPTLAVDIDRLIRFAEFGGVGSYTTRGLGVVTRAPAYQNQ